MREMLPPTWRCSRQLALLVAERRPTPSVNEAYRAFVDSRPDASTVSISDELDALKSSAEWIRWHETRDALDRASRSLDAAVARLEKLERKK